jgi:hypothetical protein
MSLRLSAMPADSTMLILAPPTEYFTEHLLRFNARGESHLVRPDTHRTSAGARGSRVQQDRDRAVPSERCAC